MNPYIHLQAELLMEGGVKKLKEGDVPASLQMSERMSDLVLSKEEGDDKKDENQCQNDNLPPSIGGESEPDSGGGRKEKMKKSRLCVIL